MSFEDRMKLEELYKYEDGLRNKIWNEAIEIAAIKLSYYCNDLRIIDEIRKLKKRCYILKLAKSVELLYKDIMLKGDQERRKDLDVGNVII